MDFWWILYIVDGLLFVTVTATVAYFTVFVIASQIKRGTKVVKSKRQNRIIVLIPAYKCDKVIERTVNSVLGQMYPQRLFDVVVISDHQSEITNFKLAQYPITLLTPNFKKSTKGKALQYAINNLPQFKIYDIAVVLDADNIVLPEFLEEINLEESGLDRMIKASYDLLGLMSFLTAGKKEVRAWTIRKGTKAPQAAGVIHSDFEKGFIRAEIVKYDDLIALGSWYAAKEKGLMHSEGKDYVMQDGDVVVFLFNV